MKNLDNMGLTGKSDCYGGEGGSQKTNIQGRNCVKWEAWTVCSIKSWGELAKKRGRSQKGELIPQCALCVRCLPLFKEE